KHEMGDFGQVLGGLGLQERLARELERLGHGQSMDRGLAETIGRTVEVGVSEHWIGRSVILLDLMERGEPPCACGPDLRIGLSRYFHQLAEAKFARESHLPLHRGDWRNKDRKCGCDKQN